MWPSEMIITWDYENFADGTKGKVAQTLTCSKYSFRQAEAEQPYLKCF